MQAIEFEANLKNGIIQMPSFYQHWQEGKQAKIIVLVDENNKQPVKVKSRQPGYLKNKIVIHEDFNEPMSEEELALWYDSPIFPSN
jgi:hypothetical protein